MKVFITGIAGFLGSHLAENCLKNNHQVVGCDTLIGGNLSNLDNLDIEFHNTDIENLDEMTKILKNVDIICHAASYAHEGLSSVSPKLICQNNLVGSVSTFIPRSAEKVTKSSCSSLTVSSEQTHNQSG